MVCTCVEKTYSSPLRRVDQRILKSLEVVGKPRKTIGHIINRVLVLNSLSLDVIDEKILW